MRRSGPLDGGVLYLSDPAAAAPLGTLPIMRCNIWLVDHAVRRYIDALSSTAWWTGRMAGVRCARPQPTIFPIDEP